MQYQELLIQNDYAPVLLRDSGKMEAKPRTSDGFRWWLASIRTLANLCWIVAGFSLAVATGSASVAPPGGIVGWWTGDGDASNLVGAPGTLGGGVGFTAGEVGQAFQFSGSGQYVATDLDTQPSALPTTTWEAWVYPTLVNVGARQQILSIDSGSYGRSVLIESGSTNFGIFTGSGVWVPAGVSVGQWQHIAVVFGPTNIWFYKNGVEYSLGQAPTLRSSSNKLNIGRNPSFGEYFSGSIDEVTVYDRALSLDEIKAIYSAGPEGKLHVSSASADLSVTNSTTPEPVSLGFGQNVTNEIVVRNLGPDPAIGVSVSAVIPPSCTFVSASSPANWYLSGGSVYFLPGDLTNGETLSLNVVVTPGVAGTLTNRVTAGSLASDPSVANNSSAALSHVAGHYTPSDGDWLAPYALLTNTPEAQIMVRVGDIDNMGFGWPAGFNPFSGNSTPTHGFPWTPGTNDPAGTDRIMVVSSFNGHPPAGEDGYTSSTSRPGNAVQPIVLTYNLAQQPVASAVLQIFVDDFQAPVWGASYQVTLNNVRAPFLESIINGLVQTGPVGKLITIAIPADYLYLVQGGSLAIEFDDPTTGAGDGYAIDFVKLLINVTGFAQSGTIHGTVTDADTQLPLPGVLVTAQGLSTAITDASGQYTLTNVAAGLVSVTASLRDYAMQARSTDLIASQTNQLDFALSLEPILHIQLLPPNQVLLYWPGTLTGFGLQTSVALKSAPWTAEGSVPALVDGYNMVTNTVGGGSRFYRLAK